jgi:hypothetical protein
LAVTHKNCGFGQGKPQIGRTNWGIEALRGRNTCGHSKLEDKSGPSGAWKMDARLKTGISHELSEFNGLNSVKFVQIRGLFLSVFEG